MNLNAITEKLHNHGLKSTPQRVWVYDYLCTHRTHPDADEIYTSLSGSGHTLTRATIYNVLQALVKKGLVTEVKADASRTRYDAKVELHGHFICSRCKAIYDFDVDKLSTCGLDGFETRQKDVYFSGVCNKCNNILKQGDKSNEKICM